MRTRPLVMPRTACWGMRLSAFCGSLPVMDRTAPCSWSSATWTTCDGMQVAWANASTAVSSPMNSTVLVRSWSESPGVRQEVQS